MTSCSKRCSTESSSRSPASPTFSTRSAAARSLWRGARDRERHVAGHLAPQGNHGVLEARVEAADALALLDAHHRSEGDDDVVALAIGALDVGRGLGVLGPAQ